MSKNWCALCEQFLTAKQARADKKTVDWYKARLRHWTAFVTETGLKPKKVRTEHLDQFAGRLKADGLAYSTRQGTLTALKGFFGWLRVNKHVKRNPFANFEPLRKERRPVQPIARAHALRMIQAAESCASSRAIRDAAIMRLLLTTGLRRAEVVNLRYPAIDLVENALIVTGKFDHRRAAFLVATARAALVRWLEHRPDELTHDYVFTATRPAKGIYKPLRPLALNQILEFWRDRAGLPPVSVSPHKWRHRFATDLARGGNPFGLQLLLGHSDIAASVDYVHHQPDDLRALVERYVTGAG